MCDLCSFFSVLFSVNFFSFSFSFSSSPSPLLLPRYSEFLAATVSMQVKLDRKTLEDAFNRLDVSNTKSLTKDDLTKALGEVYSEEHIQGERDRLLRERERERGREREREMESGCVDA